MTINLTKGTPRQPLAADDAKALRNVGVLVEDPRRDRPRYFDGRFLAARDLIRDQQYFLTREADLGRAAGSGVAEGLYVDQGATPQGLTIAAGHGITPAGELVMLPEQVTLNLADLPLSEQYSAKFGLSRLPTPPARSRTGLYVLALRPVEYTANPVGAYPTSLTGTRTVEDGDIIEATALVLVPWDDDGSDTDLLARRGHAARTIFTQAEDAGVAANLLPIAMLALQSNSIVWIDEAMVRRELGADRGDLPGLGFAPRGLRLAHLMQHQTHLADLVKLMGARRFTAASQFSALPPAGPLPVGCIDVADFTQHYFPAVVDVDFSIIPEDELPALVEESLALPPIDFLASEAALDLTAVLILAPVPRDKFRSVLATLNDSRVRPLKAAAPNLVAQRKPLEILQRLRLPLSEAGNPAVTSAAATMWIQLARQNNLWYVRRRNLAYRDDLAGTPVAVAGINDLTKDIRVKDRAASLGLDRALDQVMSGGSTQAGARVIDLLDHPKIAASPTLTAAAIGALNAEMGRKSTSPAGTLDHAGVLKVAADLTDGGVGNGLTRLEQATGQAPADLAGLAADDAWRDLDQAAATAAASELANLSAPVKPARRKTAAKPAAKTTTKAASSKKPA